MYGAISKTCSGQQWQDSSLHRSALRCCHAVQQLVSVCPQCSGSSEEFALHQSEHGAQARSGAPAATVP